MLRILKPPKLVDLDELIRVQERVAERVVPEDRWRKLERVAGCDISLARGDRAYASCAVLDRKSLRVLDQKVARVRLRFPYIPTFLALRELEGLLELTKNSRADVYMVGAHGLAHPRGAGLACHLGVVLGKPVLGVAKSKLCGEAEEPKNARNTYTLLRDDGRVIGAVVRTQTGVKPVYVSVGHMLSLKTAIRITLETARKYRLPEPLRIAHILATRAMRGSK